MRPLYLEMSAFGAFGGVEKIDFTKLRSNLFLISGKTGAGKTTIFDAVSYALYGKMSGSVRESSSARSDFAEICSHTFVLLKFIFRGNVYTIKRCPAYARKKLTGEGITQERPKVEMHLPDGSVLTEERTVSEKIMSLLGLNHSQWKQVAMIAQGEFTKCLHAESNERSAIFRNIFATGIYGALSAKLKEEELAAKKNCESMHDSLAQYISGINCDADSQRYAELCEARTVRTIGGAVRCSKILEALISDDLARHSDLTMTCGDLQKRLDEKNSAIDGANIINRNISELEREKCARNSLLSKEQFIIERSSFAQKAEAYLNEIGRLEVQIEKSKEVQHTQATIDKLNEQLSVAEAALLDVQKKTMSLKEASKEASRILDIHMDSKLNLHLRLSELDKTNQAIARFNSLAVDVARCIALKNDCRAHKAAYNEMRSKNSVVEAEFLRKQELFRIGQSGILAETLAEGAMCPVCGSTNHPSKAVKIVGVPTETELKVLEKEFSRAQDDEHKAEIALNGKITEGREVKKSIIKDAGIESGFSEITPLHEISAWIRDGLEIRGNEAAALIEAIADLENTVKNFDSADQALREYAAEIELLDASEKCQMDRLLVIKSRIAEKEGELNEIKRGVMLSEIESSKRLVAICDELGINSGNGLSERIKEGIAEAKMYIDSYNSSLTSVTAKIETLSKLIGDSKPRDIEEIEAEALLIKTEKNRVEAERADKWAFYKANSRLLEKINHGISAFKKAQQMYSMTEKLSKTANGELKGKQKLTLEMYVQRAYFHKILNTANIRLSKMTNGRYELIRKQVATNLRDKSFALDLDIFDSLTGKTRPVTSLSGGESFIAALALALALSDTIQQEAGGVEIGTIFIDEGFGSLDPEHLVLVINTLSSLINDGSNGKLIGVISHVEALKDNIDSQINIRQQPYSGSSAIVR